MVQRRPESIKVFVMEEDRDAIIDEIEDGDEIVEEEEEEEEEEE